MAKNKNPVKRISYGSVNASIFLNEDKESGNKWFSTTIQKFYNSGTKKKPEWEYTNSYNKEDFQYLELVRIEALKWICENKIGDLEVEDE